MSAGKTLSIWSTAVTLFCTLGAGVVWAANAYFVSEAEFKDYLISEQIDELSKERRDLRRRIINKEIAPEAKEYFEADIEEITTHIEKLQKKLGK